MGALTDSIVEMDRTISMLQAARDGMLAVGARLALQVAEEAGHEDFGDLTTRAVAAEFAAALRVSDRTVQRRMSEASFLVERFPRVWQAQGAGRISADLARSSSTPVSTSTIPRTVTRTRRRWWGSLRRSPRTGRRGWHAGSRSASSRNRWMTDTRAPGRTGAPG